MATPEEVDVWVGLDVGKDEHFAEVLDDHGDRLFSRAVTNDQAALERLLDRAAGYGTPGWRSTSPARSPSSPWRSPPGGASPVAYVPGLVMRRAADLYPGEAKTDRRDAYVLADTARTRRRQVHWLDTSSDELLARLRVLNGFDIDLAADQTRLTNRLRDALTSIAPALERALGDRLAPGRRPRPARPVPDPDRAARRRADRASSTSIAARSPRVAGKVTRAVQAALAAQTVTVPAEAATGRVIAELAAELDRVCARRDTLAKEIEEAFLAHPFGELLATLPGIGPRTGARILAEIGDGSAFATGSKLAAYAGLAPVTRQSGKSLAAETRSRRGNHRLKNALFLAAFASLRSPDSKAFYDRKRAEGKTPQRRPHLPGPPALRRHPGHAAHRPALPHPPTNHRPPQSRLTP